jgi:hypothetical protein
VEEVQVGGGGTALRRRYRFAGGGTALPEKVQLCGGGTALPEEVQLCRRRYSFADVRILMAHVRQMLVNDSRMWLKEWISRQITMG